MAVLRGKQDAYGLVLAHQYESGVAVEIIERDDGFIDTGSNPGHYVAEFKDWSELDRKLIRYVRGRVLDVGCGAGRVALHLQSKGFDVIATDNSAGAVTVCRKRGVKQVKALGLEDITPALGTFDTIAMFGATLELMGTPARARKILKTLARMTSDDGRLIGTVIDPYRRARAEHRRYHRANRARGRMAGEIRVRVRYLDRTSPWFKLLLLSPKELTEIVEGTGWRVDEIIDDDGLGYAPILMKVDRRSGGNS